MPTSPLYDSTCASLRNALPAALDSQIDTLALAMVGVVVSGSSAIGRIGPSMNIAATRRKGGQETPGCCGIVADKKQGYPEKSIHGVAYSEAVKYATLRYAAKVQAHTNTQTSAVTNAKQGRMGMSQVRNFRTWMWYEAGCVGKV